MGTMGVIYSVVLEVVEQYGIRQVVTATNWDRILVAASTSEGASAANDISANRGVLQVLLDGTLNGTGIPLAENVYADLAINPFTRELDNKSQSHAAANRRQQSVHKSIRLYFGAYNR